MCSACGIIGGGPDWLDRVGVPDGIGATSGQTRLGERQQRITLVNRVLASSGAKLSDFNGRLVVKSATGKTRIVDDLAHVWLAADQIGCPPRDPLRDDWMPPRACRR